MEKDSTPFIDYPQYLKSKSLTEALGVYSDAQTLKAFDESYKADKPNGVKFAPLIMAVGETFSNLGTLSETQAALLAKLKHQVTALVKTKALIPAGFREPRASTSKPEIIPLPVFLSDGVNWDKSEISYDGQIFLAIRLVEDDTSKIKANNFQRSGGLACKIAKSDRSNFAGLGPSRHLNEKDAAHYLGISSRTLQGMRVKGEGPEFTKTGQAIRYKFADLEKWATKA